MPVDSASKKAGYNQSSLAFFRKTSTSETSHADISLLTNRGFSICSIGLLKIMPSPSVNISRQSVTFLTPIQKIPKFIVHTKISKKKEDIDQAFLFLDYVIRGDRRFRSNNEQKCRNCHN